MLRYAGLAFALFAAALSSGALAAPDGHLDPAFGENGLQTVAFNVGNDQAYGLAVLPDGRILLAGEVTGLGFNRGIGLTRLSAGGQIDEGFGRPWYHPGVITDLWVYDAALQPDGKLAVVGSGRLAVDDKALVCRFLPDGGIDPGFATAQPNLLQPGCRLLTTSDDSVFTTLTLQRDGRIALAGYTRSLQNQFRGLLGRLDAQGNFDAEFNGNGIHLLPNLFDDNWALRDIAQTPAGDLIAIGRNYTGNSNWQVLRLRGEDGALDESFGNGGVRTIAIDHVANGADYAIAVSALPDGRIVVGGAAEGANNVRCPTVARLWPDGQPDDTLGPNGVFLQPALCLSGMSISDMLVQSDGRVVLAGYWSGSFFATRFLPDGGIDLPFGLDLGLGDMGVTWFDFGAAYGLQQTNSYANRIASHAGRLLMAGQANSGGDGGFDFAIARLDNDLIYADDLE